MARRGSQTLTEREAQIMRILWARGECTAEEIRAALPDDPHDSTVRTLLRVLEQKKAVRHTRRGKAYVYEPIIQKASAERNALQSMIKRFFGGSAEALVLRLIEDKELTPEQLEALRQQVEAEGQAPPEEKSEGSS